MVRIARRLSLRLDRVEREQLQAVAVRLRCETASEAIRECLRVVVKTLGIEVQPIIEDTSADLFEEAAAQIAASTGKHPYTGRPVKPRRKDDDTPGDAPPAKKPRKPRPKKPKADASGQTQKVEERGAA